MTWMYVSVVKEASQNCRQVHGSTRPQEKLEDAQRIRALPRLSSSSSSSSNSSSSSKRLKLLVCNYKKMQVQIAFTNLESNKITNKSATRAEKNDFTCVSVIRCDQKSMKKSN